MKSRFTACVYAAAFAAVLCAPGGAMAKDFHLKISHWVPPSHPLQKALEDWAASVKKETGGTITSTIYPSQQLGKAFDRYDMARDGIADMTFINPGYTPGRFPIIAAGELPFLMSNATGRSVALNEWYRKYAAKEMKDVKFCLAFVHDPGSFHMVDNKVRHQECDPRDQAVDGVLRGHAARADRHSAAGHHHQLPDLGHLAALAYVGRSC